MATAELSDRTHLVNKRIKYSVSAGAVILFVAAVTYRQFLQACLAHILPIMYGVMVAHPALLISAFILKAAVTIGAWYYYKYYYNSCQGNEVKNNKDGVIDDVESLTSTSMTV